jgi:lipopolysaccharide/colanic/teichoic acid biosynthesis glycosyltransferase
LLSRLSKAIGKPSYLLNVPAKVLQILFTCIGKRVIAQRLLGNLQADIGKSCDLLGWTPPFSVDDCLKYCVENNIETNKSTQNFSLRFFDIIFSAFGLIVGLPVFGVIFLSGWFDTGSPLFFQERIGRNKKPFTLVKFRTMKLDTASVASHLASSSSITRMGAILRKTKLDELPQLWNVLKGEMSLVGPRPCLFNQDELIRERDERGVFAVRPGVTGLAQVNEIDMSTPELLAKTDLEMIETMSVKNYFRFIFMTIAGNGAGDCIKK